MNRFYFLPLLLLPLKARALDCTKHPEKIKKAYAHEWTDGKLSEDYLIDEVTAGATKLLKVIAPDTCGHTACSVSFFLAESKDCSDSVGEFKAKVHPAQGKDWSEVEVVTKKLAVDGGGVVRRTYVLKESGYALKN